MRVILHFCKGVPNDGAAGKGAYGLSHLFHRFQCLCRFHLPRHIGKLPQTGKQSLIGSLAQGKHVIAGENKNCSLLDTLVLAPCTGNTLAKLSHSIADTPVTMAAKSHLRNGRPVVVAISTNDGLAGAAENIGHLLARKNYYFVPYGQDDSEKKPTSLVAHFEMIPATVDAAVLGKQIQPLIQ